MAQTNQQTRSRSKKNSRSWLPWLLIALALGLFIGGLLLTRNKDTATPEPTNFTDQMQKFFKPNGSIATFNREGNTLVETTTWLNEQYIQLIIESNESKKQEIYHINEQTIDLVYVALHIEEAKTFTDSELADFQVIDTILHWPLDSKRFGSKKMTYPVQFETSFLVFANAVRIERNDESGITLDYYAEGYGFIGREFIINDKLFNKIQLNELTE